MSDVDRGRVTKKAVLYLHGFASSAQGMKARFLRQKFSLLPQATFCAVDFNPTPRDFEHMTTTGLINRLRQYVLDHRLHQACIIGSSYGALVAVHYAHRFGHVERMLLLAPVLRWRSAGLSCEGLLQWEQEGTMPVYHCGFGQEIPLRLDLQLDAQYYVDLAPAAAPTLIIHGRDDQVTPIEDSRAYASAFPDQVCLVEVDAGHDLNGLLPLIWEHTESFLLDAK